MTTRPGFSSRTTSTTVTQFPHRDEIAMSETPGWSNSAPAKDDAKTSEPDEKVVEHAEVEDKAVRKAAPRKK
ncbi:MAG: hypothetical protein ACXV5Q_00710 [Frankiaceae bacterium]